ncbi:hypothetical protein [Neobacillus thermocopriae]|uniref:Uncharacterized protein n=1 Tax=Neobacillus thermocopriae TaxID=1215031 RepID=A0A6B3TU29_9BACI|nr:hypothetical protein [Neobacillus thermocopriae]MED3623367.1 hypothetical protein [Neobacillus thermocopriae]MED3715651.1 hypothetical protein [Neobacillus thermocopriae]NEX79779.1 hypothetical protein [Neobacillus thermocopriae]
MKTPNYHDFYQKALIPIGRNDLKILKDTYVSFSESSHTHWLIAVEGVQLPQSKIYFHWKVSIYPANDEGDFNWKKPYYCSANMENMDQAIALASSLMKSSRKDELSSAVLLEKIS